MAQTNSTHKQRVKCGELGSASGERRWDYSYELHLFNAAILVCFISPITIRKNWNTWIKAHQIYMSYPIRFFVIFSEFYLIQFYLNWQQTSEFGLAGCAISNSRIFCVDTLRYKAICSSHWTAWYAAMIYHLVYMVLSCGLRVFFCSPVFPPF